MGSGPFKFKRFSKSPAPVVIEGVRNPDYYDKDKPYLDGFRAIYEKQQAWRVEAIRKGTFALVLLSRPALMATAKVPLR